MKTPKLLLVEDDTSLATTLKERLTKEGYSICWVNTLAKARAELSNSNPNLIILDVGLPDGSGFDLAKELSALRNKGVLIIGSGNMVHNLGMVAWEKLNEPEYAYDWALEASTKMKKYILDGDHQQLINYKTQGKAFNLAIPSPEHYLPLLYTLALKDENEKVSLFNDKALGGSLTMTSLKIEKS